MRKIVKLFREGNVMVYGMRGSGKDVLFGNVVMRRRKSYISNTNYGGDFIKFDPAQLDCKNTWRNFMTNKLNHYVYPYPDKVDFYIPDVGVYMPSTYQADLCKEYPHIPVFLALSRHLGECNVHTNCQAIPRIWDKLREQSETYIRCMSCDWLLGFIVIQKIIIYEKYESAVAKVPPFCLKRPLINPNRLQLWEIQKMNYQIAHGKVEPRTLIYINLSKHNTRVFKEMLENA